MGEKKEKEKDKKEKEKKDKEEKKALKEKEKEEKKALKEKEKEKKKEDKKKDSKKASRKDIKEKDEPVNNNKLAFSYGAVDLGAVSLTATPPPSPSSARDSEKETDSEGSPSMKTRSAPSSPSAGSPFSARRENHLPPSSLSLVEGAENDDSDKPDGDQSSAQPSSSTNASPPPSPSLASTSLLSPASSSNAHMSMYFIEEDRQREMEEIEKEVLKMELKKKMSSYMYESVIKFESDVAQLRKQVEAVRKREKLAFLRAEKEKREERERLIKEQELREAMKGGEAEGVSGKINMFKKIAEGGGGVRLGEEGEKRLLDQEGEEGKEGEEGEKEGEEGEKEGEEGEKEGEEGEEGAEQEEAPKEPSLFKKATHKEGEGEGERERGRVGSLLSSGRRDSLLQAKKAETQEEEKKEEEKEEEKKEEKKEETEEQKVGRMRSNVIKEFLDTERDYIEDIHTLLKVFVYPMQVTSMITAGELKTIFSNIEDVVPIHESFLEKLESQITEHIENGGEKYEVELGGLLSRFFHYFKLYSIYASNQDASLELLEQLKKKKEISGFLEVCHSDPNCKGQFLNSYLIKPIQRLCKYPLLLRELIKYTPEEHPDFKALQDSTDKVNSVVNYVNEAKRKEEKAKRMRAVATKFGIKDLVREGRALIKEGKLGAWKKGGAKEDRYLFVFNDLVLVMKPVKKGDDKSTTERLLFKKIASADLSKTRIINHSDRPEDGMVSAFEIVFDDKSLMFCCASEADKKAWVKCVKESIKEFQKQAIARMKKEKELEEQLQKERGGSGSDSDACSSPSSKKKNSKSKAPLKRAISIGGNSSGLTPRGRK